MYNIGVEGRLLHSNNPDRMRVYADTSVYGGVFDTQFHVASRSFFEHVLEGKFELVISAIVAREIEAAPVEVRELFDQMSPFSVNIEISEAALRLHNGYLKARILTPKWHSDAFHVALASVSNCNAIISWNFRHIVNFNKIPLYNAVNRIHGYHEIGIFSPLEVMFYDE